MSDISEASAHTLKQVVVAEAQRLGLDAIAVTTPDAIPHAAQRLARFVALGRHGDMAWMQETLERRGCVSTLWPQAQSVIMVGHSYAPVHNPLDALSEHERALISVYARGRDYHDVLKGKIRQLAYTLAKTSGADVKIFVDTAPLMEKPLAQAAGLGWQGKHTNLVSRTHGSWLFLGAILTTAKLTPDAAEVDHCGSCRRCLDVCPTSAFPAPYELDARRCLAYLTIEHAGPIAREFRKPMGNRVFGCDDCLAVCPWNKFAQSAREMRYAARPETDNPPIADLLALSDAEFRQRFSGTPVKRTGRNRVVRNALIAAGNSGERHYIAQITHLLTDAAPLVRAMAVWALSQLASPAEFAALRATYAPGETDADVQSEWQSEWMTGGLAP